MKIEATDVIIQLESTYAKLDKYEKKRDKWNDYMRNYYHKRKEFSKETIRKEKDFEFQRNKIKELYEYDESKESMIRTIEVHDKLREHCPNFRLRNMSVMMEELGYKIIKKRYDYYTNIKLRTSQE